MQTLWRPGPHVVRLHAQEQRNGVGVGLADSAGGLPAGRPGSHGFCLQAWLAEVEGRLPARGDQARRQSGMYDGQTAPAVNNCAQDRERYSI